MLIGAVSNPRDWQHWGKVEAYLDPARKLGGFDTVLEDDEALFVVLDEGELLACATARMTEHGCEIILVGGRDRKLWLAELDSTIGAAARGAGATRLYAMGRRGWLRELRRLGWEEHGVVDGMTVYARELRG